MIRNYLKIAIRNLFRNPVYAFINLIGLAAGMTIFLLVTLWVYDEYAYDSYFSDHEKIGVILSTQTWNEETSTYPNAGAPLADQLRRKYSDDLKSVVVITETLEFITGFENKKIGSSGIWAEPSFPSFFSIKMKQGAHSALNEPSNLLVSESFAKSLFGKNNPVNKIVLINNKFRLKVAGVYEDFPPNSRFSGLRLLLPWQNNENPGHDETSWSNHHYQVFGKLAENSTFENATKRIKDATKPFIKTNSKEELSLQSINEARLYDQYENGKAIGGRIEYVRLFTLIGIFVLLLACINFTNLSTARSEKRAKEIGIRKAVGSLRIQLIFQFFFESFLLTVAAFVIAILFTLIAIPFFNTLTEKQIAFPWANPSYWLFSLLLIIVGSLLAGSYPAFYLSSFSTTRVIKGGSYSGVANSLFRKILVVGQFSISIGLIVGAVTIFRQINYVQNRSTGYTKNNLLTAQISTPEILSNYEPIRNELLQSGFVESVTASSSPITSVRNHIVSFDWKGRDQRSAPLIGLISVTHDFGKTLKWQLKEGRDFSRDFPADSADDGGFVINEATVKLIGFKNPVGQKIKMGMKEHEVLGVVEDMVMESPYAAAGPTVFWLNYNWRINVITLRVNKDRSLKEAHAAIETIFNKYSPGNRIDFQLVDEQFAWKFFDEQQLGKLVLIFTFLAILISCLGLFGLSSFVTERRTKEIGIRKVMGASVFEIWKILTRQFTVLIVVSFVIAAPITFMLLQQWLEKYEYRTNLPGWILLVVGLGTLVVALLTVSYQVIKAASVNPVKALKTD